MNNSDHLKIARALRWGHRTPHYRAIGEFLVEYSRLEYFVKICIACAVGANEDAVDYVAVGPTRSLISSLTELLKQRHGAAAGEYLALLSSVHKLADDSNHIAHAFWEDHESGLVAKFVSSSSKRSEKFHEVEAIEARSEDARRLAEEILSGYLILVDAT
jgi:hypothetical protein